MSNNNPKKKKLDPTSMSAAPKELLGGSNAAITAGNDVVNFPRDMNNIFKGIGNAWNSGVMGDWYDPDHQTVAYKLLHPQQQAVKQAIQDSKTERPNATPAQVTQEAVHKVLPSSIGKKPVPQPVSMNGTTNTLPKKPNTDSQPVAKDPQTGATLNVDPQTGATVVHDPETNTSTVVSPPIQPTTPEYKPTAPIIENPVEAQNKAINERQAQIDANIGHILKSMNLPDTPENRWQVMNNMVTPQKSWELEHPVKAGLQQALLGLAQGGFASTGSNNLWGNLASGLGSGVANSIGQRNKANDDYNTVLNKFRSDAAAGLERGRVYSDVAGTSLNTGLSAGELQSRANDMQDRILKYNAQVGNQNDNQYALGATPKAGDAIGPQTQAQLLKEREANNAQKKVDDAAGKYFTLMQKIDAAKGKYSPTPDELSGLNTNMLNDIATHLSPEYRQKLTTGEQTIEKNNLELNKGKIELDKIKPMTPDQIKSSPIYSAIGNEGRNLQEQLKTAKSAKERNDLRAKLEQLNAVLQALSSSNLSNKDSLEYQMLKKFLIDHNLVQPPSSKSSTLNPLGI